MDMRMIIHNMFISLYTGHERFAHEMVRAGLYASEDAVGSDAFDRLRQTTPKPARTSGKPAKRTEAESQKPEKAMTEAEIQQRLLRSDRYG
jgi:hypothetical protein